MKEDIVYEERMVGSATALLEIAHDALVVLHLQSERFHLSTLLPVPFAGLLELLGALLVLCLNVPEELELLLLPPVTQFQLLHSQLELPQPLIACLASLLLTETVDNALQARAAVDLLLREGLELPHLLLLALHDGSKLVL